MKFLLCLVLCSVAATQAGVIGLGGAVSYSALAPVASIYRAPLTYSAPLVKTYAAPAVYSYNAVSAPVVRSLYSAPAVYAAPSLYTTLLKK